MGSDIEMVRIKSNSTGGPKGRPLNKPNYNSEAIMNEFIEALTEYFNISYDDREPVRLTGTPTLNSAAEEFGITALKARKLLITANYYSTATSRLIAELIAPVADDFTDYDGHISFTSIRTFLSSIQERRLQFEGTEYQCGADEAIPGEKKGGRGFEKDVQRWGNS